MSWLTNLYKTKLGRAPDAAGAAYFNNLAASGVPQAQIANLMGNSAEGLRYSQAQTAPRPAPTPAPSNSVRTANSAVQNRGAKPGTDYDVRNPTIQGLLPGRDLSQGADGLAGFDKLTYNQFQKGNTIQQRIANHLNSGGTYAASGAMWGNPGPGVRVTDNQGRSALVSESAAAKYQQNQIQNDLQSQIDAGLSPLQSQLDAALAANQELADKFAGLESGFNTRLGELQTAMANANAYRQSSTVGTQNSLGGFTANSGSTPMGIKQMGTGRFNRNNKNKSANQLKISNLNV